MVFQLLIGIEELVLKLRGGPLIQKGKEPPGTLPRRTANCTNDARMRSPFLKVLAGKILKVLAIVRDDHEVVVGGKCQLLFVRRSEHVLTAGGASRKAVAAHNARHPHVNVLVKIQPRKEALRFHSPALTMKGLCFESAGKARRPTHWIRAAHPESGCAQLGY